MPHAFASSPKNFKTASGRCGKSCSLPSQAKQFPNVNHLPVSMRIVLESVLRNCVTGDAKKVTAEHVAVKLGKNPKRMGPLVPADPVVDLYGKKNSLDLNMKREFQRNREPYEFMKWGMQAFGQPLGLTGNETIDIIPDAQLTPQSDATLRIKRADGSTQDVTPTLRVDTPIAADDYRAGGISPLVLRQLLA